MYEKRGNSLAESLLDVGVDPDAERVAGEKVEGKRDWQQGARVLFVGFVVDSQARRYRICEEGKENKVN